MKNLAVLIAVAVGVSFCGTLTAQEKREVLDLTEMKILTEEMKNLPGSSGACVSSISKKVLMYIPNRIADLLDTFSISLDMGLAIGITVRFTYAFGLIGEIGSTGSLIKGYNGQYGAALTEGYYGQLFFPVRTDLQRTYTYGTVDPFWIAGWKYPLRSDPVFGRRNGIFDYWAVEIGAIFLAGAKFAVHPIRILDFIAGIFFIDTHGDDDENRENQH